MTDGSWTQALDAYLQGQAAADRSEKVKRPLGGTTTATAAAVRSRSYNLGPPPPPPPPLVPAITKSSAVKAAASSSSRRTTNSNVNFSPPRAPLQRGGSIAHLNTSITRTLYASHLEDVASDSSLLWLDSTQPHGKQHFTLQDLQHIEASTLKDHRFRLHKMKTLQNQRSSEWALWDAEDELTHNEYLSSEIDPPCFIGAGDAKEAESEFDVSAKEARARRRARLSQIMAAFHDDKENSEHSLSRLDISIQYVNSILGLGD